MAGDQETFRRFGDSEHDCEVPQAARALGYGRRPLELPACAGTSEAMAIAGGRRSFAGGPTTAGISRDPASVPAAGGWLAVGVESQTHYVSVGDHPDARASARYRHV